MPEESLDLLFQEAIRQHQDLLGSKNSIETRASFMLGLQGVVLTVFTAVFTTYWASTQAANLAQTDAFAWWLGLAVTMGVLLALIAAVVLEILVLMPTYFATGIELPGSFVYAADRDHSTVRVKEETLKALIEIIEGNLESYSKGVFRYEVASFSTLAALSFAVEFVGILLVGSINPSPNVRTYLWLALSTVGIIIVGLAGVKSWRKSQAARQEQAGRDLKFEGLRTFLEPKG